ncbi:alpha/beta fold hydrolase [Shimia sp.]|uniref:alpha/beta fold hydrolase n=1 Tax=Shimia sp. TaxID=1954381 RepID=UPI003BAB84D1
MRLLINGVRLFVDFDGPEWVADGPTLRQKPTLILLHGGPGADHSIFKPHYAAALSDLCHILYLDHRGNGRSDDGDPALWTLDQWADDLATLCDVLDIAKPIVYGGSFGGFVAQAFATKYPDRLAGLILSNTTAKVDFPTIYNAFGHLVGPAAQAAAQNYWGNPTSDSRATYGQICVPHYTQTAIEPDFWSRVLMKDPVALHFNGPTNEMGRFDFRAALAKVTCPSLVISGDKDPIMPSAFSETITAALTHSDAAHHCLPNCGHLPEFDAPDTYFNLLRNFLQRIPSKDTK